LYKNKNLQCSFKATADAAVKGKVLWVACQGYQSEMFMMILKWSLHYYEVGYNKLVRQKQTRKALLRYEKRYCFTFG